MERAWVLGFGRVGSSRAQSACRLLHLSLDSRPCLKVGCRIRSGFSGRVGGSEEVEGSLSGWSV